MKSHGFTIVELVVVIAVAGIIATIGLVASSQVQKDSRDKKREADIVLLQNELEKFYETNGEYPPGCVNSCSYWFYTENVSTGGTILTEATTLSALQAILPGITANFGDPQKTSSAVLSSYASNKERYMYAGGAVNNRSYASYTDSSTPLPKRCMVVQNLSAGQVGTYVVGYWSETEERWVLKQGQHGVKMTLDPTSDASCKLS